MKLSTPALQRSTGRDAGIESLGPGLWPGLSLYPRDPLLRDRINRRPCAGAEPRGVLTMLSKTFCVKPSRRRDREDLVALRHIFSAKKWQAICRLRD